MAQVEIIDNELIIHMEGMEHHFLFLWGKNITVPLVHVEGADYNPATAKALYHGPKLMGVGVPGRGTFGLYVGEPEPGEPSLTLWDVSDPNTAIVIRLAHEKYKSIVVGVDNPEQTVQNINAAVTARGTTVGA